ncbi:MAG: DEAD/DEAH box helicase family protein [Clostridiales bacterium]|nr:DEAD/DEAH box helicase family protein [Clostridiales bacterium]
MPDYIELLAENKMLSEEVKKLRAENAELKARLGVSETRLTESANIISTPQNNHLINKLSSPEEKIALFKSLFTGRTDVFARRWRSITSGKSGYQPVCGNEWDGQLCDKKKYKCSACPNRKLLALTDNDLFNHLAGKDQYARDVVGIYPMFTDETCAFCCLDFDDEGYESAANAYRCVCAENGVPAYVERSRSGEGAHVWIFFDAPIPAKTARQLASGLLTQAMAQNKHINFSSYDRILPNQDTLPSGGFGNLIALPLQGQARKRGNSLFVDDTFAPFADQWIFLSGIQKIDIDTANTLTARLCKPTELGALVSESVETPWKQGQNNLAALDFGGSLTVIYADMIYIPSGQLSASAKNAVVRLASFKNPDYYRSQAMRMPVYNKPRVICCAENRDGYIALPRGCLCALKELLNQSNVIYEVKDETNAGTPIPVSFNGELREEQQAAANALLSGQIGVLSATTAFGKTVVASYLVGERKTNSLILVHTQALMEQWKKSLELFLQFDISQPEQKKQRGRKRVWSPVGQLGAGKDNLHGIVDIAVMQSLISDKEVKSIVKDYGMVIVDECHHVSAVNFETVLKQVNAKYVYGLTATPARQDGHHPIIFMQCGPIRYRVDAKEQAQKRDFIHFLVPRFTSFRKSYEPGTMITQIYTDLMKSDLRNNLIDSDVLKNIENGRTPIILTERKEHAITLKELLKEKCKNVIVLTGAASVRDKRETMQRLYSVPGEEPLIVIATGKYVGEGFDYPRLDTLFLALPISWKGKVAQYAGRLHRNYPGKKEVLIYDYADIHIPVLERMYQKRMKSYADIGYQVKNDTDLTAVPDVIHDGKSFYPIYLQDLKNAAKEILIVSPFMRKNRLK